MTTKWAIAVGVTLAAFLLTGHAGAATVDSTGSGDARELVVGIKEAPPFVIKLPGGDFKGISVDLWRRLADRLHLRYRFSERGDIPAILAGIKDGSLDAAIAAITVTSDRQRFVDFTQPFYTTGLGIAVATNESEWVAIARTLMSSGFTKAVLTLLGIALVVGFLIWVLERSKTHHFGGGVRGLGAGVWWSAIAMTQAGAAQDAPTTLPGRILGTCWMVASVIAIAVFTAGITSTLTKRELKGAVHGVSDLNTVRVGAVQATSALNYLDRERISYRSFSSLKEGLKALESGHLDAFVYDKPLLAWTIQQEFPDTLRVLDIIFGAQNYAVVLPKGSALNENLTMAILEETESDWWRQTVLQYLGRSRWISALTASTFLPVN